MIGKIFYLLIYNFNIFGNSSLYNNISFNSFQNNINKKIMNDKFIKYIIEDDLNILLSNFSIIIAKNEELKILYINDNMKIKINKNISSVYDIIPKNLINIHKNIINDIMIKKTLPELLNEPRDIYIERDDGSKVYLKLIFRMYIDEFNIEYINDVIFYIFTYDDIHQKDHIKNIINTLYDKNTLKYIESGSLPPPKVLDLVSIFYLDICNFSKKCESLSPDNVASWMTEIHYIIQKYLFIYSIQKIETKGDSYLCLAGTNHVSNDIPETQLTRLIDFSSNIIKELNNLNTSVRIGIHFGKVCISYIGSCDFIPLKTVYGDDVNICARMEQTSKNNIIHLTKDAADKYVNENNILLDNCKKINISYKNINNMETYYFNPYINNFINISDYIEEDHLEKIEKNSKRLKYLVNKLSNILKFTLNKNKIRPEKSISSVDSSEKSKKDPIDENTILYEVSTTNKPIYIFLISSNIILST